MKRGWSENDRIILDKGALIGLGGIVQSIQGGGIFTLTGKDARRSLYEWNKRKLAILCVT